MSYRYMRILLFFDLPTITSNDLRKYRKFVKDIRKLGFYMVQESVYVKLCLDLQVVDSVTNKVKSFAPTNGNIMLLSITEKQFSKIKIITGEFESDTIVSDDRTIIL